MIKLSKLSFILLFSLGLSAITLAAGNIYETVNDKDKEVIVYPNPVLDNEFNIKSEQEIAKVTILNVLGQAIYTKEFIEIKKVSIELGASVRGVYLVQVKTIDGTKTTKRILLK